MFYDNAINRTYGKKRRPHYTTLKKTIPEGRTSSQTNQRSIFFHLIFFNPPCGEKLEVILHQLSSIYFVSSEQQLKPAVS